MAGWPRAIAHPGLPQIRTCAISAYGSSGHGFAARGIRHHHASDAGEAPADGCSPRCGSRFANSAIRCCRVDTISGFLSIRRVSLQRFRHLAPRFPPQGPFGSVPLLQRYYQDAPTPCRPSHRASFPSLGGTTPGICLRSAGPDARPRGLGGFCARCLPNRLWVETTGSPTFPGNPSVPLPCSSTPAGSMHHYQHGAATRSPLTRPRGLPQLQRTFEAQSHGVSTRCLRFAESIARLPRKTRFRLLVRLYRTGLITRRVPPKGFRPLCPYIGRPPFPSFVAQLVSSTLLPSLRMPSGLKTKHL